MFQIVHGPYDVLKRNVFKIHFPLEKLPNQQALGASHAALPNYCNLAVAIDLPSASDTAVCARQKMEKEAPLFERSDLWALPIF
jgi:hypothetical protein